MPGMQAFLQGVQGAGADIAEDHPDRTEDECGCARANRRLSRRSGFDRTSHVATGRMPQNRPERSHVSRVVPAGDRGEKFADRDGRCHGTTLYDEQVRVPFIITFPA
jgi:hypothetical protein